MIKKKIILPIFICLVLAQLIVPISMILNKEQTLHQGISYKFETKPIDPNDPFRGKYIILSYKLEEYRLTKDIKIDKSKPVYVSIKTNKNTGYAQISDININEPTNTEDYFRTEIKNIRTRQNVSHINFAFPFNKFYMEETKAIQAEKEYIRAHKTDSNTYALIRIYKGDAAIENIFINNKEINTIAKKK